MARAPNENVNKAYELFKKGYKLIDISKELDIPSSTVRRWKKTYNWDNERSDKNSERSFKENNKKIEKKKPIVEEVNEVLKNAELTDRQRLFCIYYINCFNAAKAYKKAYECSYESALSNGYRLMENDSIRKEIENLKRHKLNRAMISEEDIFQRYLDIAYANIGDYLKFGRRRKNKWTKNKDGEFIAVIDPDTGQQDFYEYNFIELNESSDVDTSLLSEVKEGKDGISVKLKDGMKALDWLTKHMNIATDRQKAELEVLKSRIVKDDAKNNTNSTAKLDSILGQIKERNKNE
ncbi:terminase small subunit [Clostridium perfringens]|uniref:terminase small subunit n=1 Tax=Clostridium perfringens TaxID=1502 RepID=UPI0022456EF8|nr:terminase small subunit [Clostridium perfringens]MCX0360045.1 terminase small subunit [Clostridium perfringens]